MDNFDKIMEYIKTVKSNNTVSISDINQLNIDKKYLSILVKKGLLERPSRGIYTLPNTFEDEYYFISVRCKKCIFSHETALFFHNLSDRTPLNFSITLPSGYNSKYLKSLSLEFFYVKKDLHELGKISTLSPNGNPIFIYDCERTICDIVRSKRRMDMYIFSNSIKNYSKSKGKDLNKLMEYAKTLKVDKKIREYMEVLV